MFKMDIKDKDKHDGNIMLEDESTKAIMDDFWAMGASDKSAKETVPSENKETLPIPTPEKETKEKKNTQIKNKVTPADTDAAADKTATDKEVIWEQFIVAAKKVSPELGIYAGNCYAYEYVSGSGVFKIVSSTKFCQDIIQNKYYADFVRILKSINPEIKKLDVLSSTTTNKADISRFYAKVPLSLFRAIYSTGKPPKNPDKTSNKPIKTKDDLTIADSAIYALLYSYRDFKTGRCCVGTRKIANDWGVSTSVIEKGIKRLTLHGYIIRGEESIGNRGTYIFPFAEKNELNIIEK